MLGPIKQGIALRARGYKITCCGRCDFQGVSRKPPRPPRPSTHDPRPTTIDLIFFSMFVYIILTFV